eukprot:15434477-Alexandrium_andersonii.AAC.1
MASARSQNPPLSGPASALAIGSFYVMGTASVVPCYQRLHGEQRARQPRFHRPRRRRDLLPASATPFSSSPETARSTPSTCTTRHTA